MQKPAAVAADIIKQIQQERDSLAERGQKLGTIKDKFLEQGGNVPPNLTLDLFILIKDIVAHDQKWKENLSAEDRRKNLGNIVVTVQLLTSIMQLNAYDNNKLGYEGRNIWRMLRFLVKFDLRLHKPGLAAPIYTMSDNEVVNILENDIAIHLLNIVNAEINVLQPPPPPAGAGIFVPIDYAAQRTAIRNQYRNHTFLVNLNFIVIKAKELEQIDKAIAAINDINGCALILASGDPNIVPIAKKAILQYLVTIGEAVTKKNLTPQTASLRQGDFVANSMRKLLINLANKITHNEWDIGLNNVEMCLTNTNFQNILNEMPAILAIFTNLKQQLTQIIENGTQSLHYQQAEQPAGNAPLPNNALTLLHNIFTGADNNSHQRKNNNPAAFTTEAMLVSINYEGSDLRQINIYREKQRIAEKIALNAMRYHLSRIAKFLQEIEDNNDLQIETIFDNNLLRQYREFRNYMRHGNDMMDTVNPIMEIGFLLKYAVLINESIYPKLEEKYRSLHPII